MFRYTFCDQSKSSNFYNLTIIVCVCVLMAKCVWVCVCGWVCVWVCVM